MNILHEAYRVINKGEERAERGIEQHRYEFLSFYVLCAATIPVILCLLYKALTVFAQISAH